MPSTVTNSEELAAGLDEFWLGAAPDSAEHELFLDLFKRGKNFLCSADMKRMAPSRFVGYTGNSLAAHRTHDWIDGGVTDTAITRVLGNKAAAEHAENAYLRLSDELGLVPYNNKRQYWILPDVHSNAHRDDLSNHPVGRPSLAEILRLPKQHEGRMKGIVSTTVSVITKHRKQWYRARLDRTSHLRIFCGRLIVATLEGEHVWLAVDEGLFRSVDNQLRSWSWDEQGSRPENAKGQPYPRYSRPPSRNGFYSPAKDPKGLEWQAIEVAHHHYLRRVAQHGSGPDPRTKSDPDVLEEIAGWRPLETSAIAFELALQDAQRLTSSARRSRLARAPRIPRARTTLVLTFDRNADVVAEVLFVTVQPATTARGRERRVDGRDEASNQGSYERFAFS